MRNPCVGRQTPYVYGFYTLVPHSLEPDQETRISGHAGGALSGYLIAKIGIHQGAAQEQVTRTTRDGQKITFPTPVFLVIDAIVDAEMAAEHGGGRYCFIETTNEPPHILATLRGLSFRPISPGGSAMHFIKLTPADG